MFHTMPHKQASTPAFKAGSIHRPTGRYCKVRLDVPGNDGLCYVDYPNGDHGWVFWRDLEPIDPWPTYSARRHLYADPVPCTNQYAWRASFAEFNLPYERRDMQPDALYFPWGGPLDAPDVEAPGGLIRSMSCDSLPPEPTERVPAWHYVTQSVIFRD